MPQNPTPRRSRLKVSPILVLAALTAVVAVAGVAGVAGAAAARPVTIENIAFSPKVVSISKGAKVTFAFRDDGTTHNVTSTGSRRFKTIADRSSGSPSRTFLRPGTYRCACTLHPGMTGRITVR